MTFQNLLSKKIEANLYRQIVIPIMINFASVLLAVLSNWKSFNGNVTLLLEVGLPLLIIGYLTNMFLYFPILVTVRWFREKQLLLHTLVTSIIIVLWSFTPLAVIWILLSFVSLTIKQIPWEAFSLVYFWCKTLVIPLSFFYSYWKLTNESIFDSLFDAMLVAGTVLILSVIHW